MLCDTKQHLLPPWRNRHVDQGQPQHPNRHRSQPGDGRLQHWQNSEDGSFSFSGNFTGNSFADYLLGYAQSASGGLGGLGNFGGGAKYAFATISESYIQDDWKISDRFTLNLGLRYEIMLPWRGRLANFDLATGRSLLTVSPDYYVPGVGLIQGTGQPLLPERPQQIDANNFAPRLGLAYRVSAKTVIRAGGGVFYALNGAGTDLGAIAGATPPYFVTASLTSSNTTPQLIISQLFPSAASTTARGYHRPEPAQPHGLRDFVGLQRPAPIDADRSHRGRIYGQHRAKAARHCLRQSANASHQSQRHQLLRATRSVPQLVSHFHPGRQLRVERL